MCSRPSAQQDRDPIRQQPTPGPYHLSIRLFDPLDEEVASKCRDSATSADAKPFVIQSVALKAAESRRSRTRCCALATALAAPARWKILTSQLDDLATCSTGPPSQSTRSPECLGFRVTDNVQTAFIAQPSPKNRSSFGRVLQAPQRGIFPISPPLRIILAKQLALVLSLTAIDPLVQNHCLPPPLLLLPSTQSSSPARLRWVHNPSYRRAASTIKFSKLRIGSLSTLLPPENLLSRLIFHRHFHSVSHRSFINSPERWLYHRTTSCNIESSRSLPPAWPSESIRKLSTTKPGHSTETPVATWLSRRSNITLMDALYKVLQHRVDLPLAITLELTFALGTSNRPKNFRILDRGLCSSKEPSS
ncbi:hypothetical protein DFJ73DRAFT_142837 [Zopfochytrium polystomum]|nr:hypothetical protein DFJ73DRAFT_142837 [Zopfochytrium polystomum]